MRAGLAWWPAVALAFVAGVLPLLLALGDVIRQPAQAANALLDPLLWSRLWTTLGIAAAVLALMLPLGLLQGWLLARSDLPLRRWLLALTPFPLFLPPLAHVLTWFGALQLHGAPAMALVYVISFTPLVTLLVARALSQVGRAQHETMLLIGGRRLALWDELRQALPAAQVGCALALVFLLSDFAVADFLTSVGPKVTVYADTLYAHHLALRPAGAAAASLPGMVLCLGLLAWALRQRRALGTAVGPRFVAAPPVRLGRLRLPLLGVLLLLTGAGSLWPLTSLALQVGSWAVLREQAVIAAPRVWFTLWVGALAAGGMTLLGLALAGRRRHGRWLDMLVLLPLAAPPLLYGIGLVRLWNQPGLDAIYLGVGVVLIALMGRYLAFAYLPLGGDLERLDPAMFDAARLAGARPWQWITGLLLPLLRGPLIATWLVTFCFTLRELDTLIMLRAGQSSLTFHLYANVVFARQDETAALALLLAGVTFAPLLVYLGVSRAPLRLV